MGLVLYYEDIFIMLELPDCYVFETLQNGTVFFHKKSYERHAEYHPIGRAEDRRKIQETLINPDFITEHRKIIDQKEVLHRTYYLLEGERSTKTYLVYFDWWQVVLRNIDDVRWKWCIVSALPGGGPDYVMINKRIERVVYAKANKYE